MITPITQAAIAVLNDIYGGASACRIDRPSLTKQQLCDLFHKLVEGKLITLADKEHPQLLSSYKPLKTSSEVSLLDILEATGEHLNCNKSTSEELYENYGRAAKKLGVVNHMTRIYLEEIKLYDL